MEQKRPIPTERLSSVRQEMVEHFTLSELRDLCFELGINWEQLSGDTLDSKTTSLLERLNRQARLPILLLQLHTLRPGVAWALDDLDEVAAPPYKGLAFYDRQDAGLFFGRERVIGELVALAGRRSLVAVVGKSGSGKSSVVRAGVVPALRGDRPPPEGAALPRDCQRWLYLEMLPTARPLEQLAIVLTRDLTTAAATQTALAELYQDPATAAIHLGKYLERQSAPRACLLVDQFEELYTVCKDEAARAAFNAGLLAVAESGRATVFITLRADFLHHFIDYPNLWPALDENKFLIRAMNEAELREAVEQPALTTGYELEPGLSDVIVRDVGQDAATLPLLSHALLETWRRREGWLLTHAGYNAAGGVGGAIAKTAERAYGNLDPAQQKVARRIFLELTELGEGAEDTRRSVLLADLLPGDPAKRAAAEVVLDALYRARLVTADAAAAQVTHEAIIREWPALREWLRDEREALRLERRLEDAAGEWHAGGRDASYLYDGAQLAAAGQWAADNPDNVSPIVRDFLDAATAEEEREAAEREAEQQAKLAQAQRLAEEAEARARAEALAAEESNRWAMEAQARASVEARAARTSRRWLVVAGVLLALAVGAAVLAALQGQEARASARTAVAAQSTTAFEATRAEVNLNEANAAKATADFNEQQSEIERDNAVVALNDSNARLLLNESERVFESDPLLADRLLLEAMAVAGSETASSEAAVALADKLLTGRAIMPITSTVTSFTGIHTGTMYLANYLLGNDGLVSGATGALSAPLNGNLYVGDSRTSPYYVLENPFFVVIYEDMRGDLRRTDEKHVITLADKRIIEVVTMPDSSLFAVTYDDSSAELRWTDGDQVIKLEEIGDLSFGIGAIAGGSFFTVAYDEGLEELRRQDNGQVVPLGDNPVQSISSVVDSSLFTVRYTDGLVELRRGDNGQVIPLGDNPIQSVYSIDDSALFIVSYTDGSVALGQIDSKDFLPLEGEVYSAHLISDSPFFYIVYPDGRHELRWKDNGQVVPLNNGVDDFFLIRDTSFFIVEYVDGSGELRRRDDGQVVLAHDDLLDGYPIPNSPFFFVRYSNGWGELRQRDDGQIVPLDGSVIFAYAHPDNPFFVVDYSGAPGQLRQRDGEQVFALAGEVNDAYAIPGSPFFIVDYADAPTQLIRVDSGQAVPFEGDIDAIKHIPDTDLFVVDYADGLDELHRTDTAQVVTDKSDQRIAEAAVVLSAERGYNQILFQDGSSAISSGHRAIVSLGSGVEQALYFPETNRVAVRYGDGRVVYIDLNLIEALGGADAEETLAEMTREELIAFTCDTLFTDNPDWDEAKLEEYLASLLGGAPRACQ